MSCSIDGNGALQPDQSLLQQEQPLLQLFLPNKVEYYCNKTRMEEQNRFRTPPVIPRRHSSVSTSNESSFENMNSPPLKVNIKPPPVPARLNKSPPVPERRASTDIASADSKAQFAIRLPPPPQPAHKRGVPTTNPGDTAEPLQNSMNFPEIKTLTPLQNAALFNSMQHKSGSDENYFKFPSKPRNDPSPDETFSQARRKSGKKIPPPIHTYQMDTDATPEATKIPSRHDSNLSCSDGGASQTPSPSYLVRSLESPLLPKVKTTNRYTRKKFFVNKLFTDSNEFDVSQGGKGLSPPDLTKSQSTPGGLQTVVDYQGTHLPYQHKVIRSNDKSSSAYFSRSQLKFQFIQIIINVIVLLAVAGALALYFRAYPPVTTIKYINHTVINLHNGSQKPTYYAEFHHVFDDYGSYCTLITTRFCLSNRIPYNYTVLPNYFGSTEREAEIELDVYEALTNVRCYQLAPLYLCALFLPKCGANGLPIKPCRNLCIETTKRCGLFLEVFGLQLPKKVDCSSLPMSDNTEDCVGYKEVIQHELQERTVACSDGFKCDERRCIPADWRCDGHIDCQDETDELHCVQCPGQLHCGMGTCIATTHICDGILNCPWGQDERNCVRLSEQMGDLGFGYVEVFTAQDKAFKSACITSWDSQNSPELVCELLGYKRLNSTSLQKKSSKHINFIQYNRENMEQNKAMMFHDFKSCKTEEDYPIVKAMCSSYVCGMRKESIGFPSTRIVGGTASSPGDWPFLAAILGGPMEIFYCAGVLISDQWVLSAAHCIGNFNLSHPPKDWTIQLGMTRRSSHSYFGQRLKVRRVIPHPSYNEGIPHNNDIALFQLAERVKFHDHLLPVCMPNSTTDLIPPRNCTVIGWGKREDNDISDYEPTVNEVEVPILNRSLCNNWLEKRDLKVSLQMICAGYEHGGKDACQGDSGGPLLCREDSNPDRWFVGGIVSWGIKCAHPHLPGIYANVPRFVTWIEHQMSLHSERRRY